MNKAVSVVLAVILVLGCTSFSFASSSPLPVPLGEVGMSYDTGLYLYTDTDNDPQYLFSTVSGCYFFIYSDDTAYYLITCLKGADNSFKIMTLYHGTITSSTYKSSARYADTTYDYVYSSVSLSRSLNNSFNSSIPVYSSLSEGFEAVDNVLSGPVVTGSYSLPCGNTIYIDLGQGSSFDLSFNCTFRNSAGALNSTFADTFYYAFANSIPQTTSSFTPSIGTYITMYKDMDSANVLGYTKVGYGSITGTTTGQYLVIVNPLMYAQSTNVYNTTLKISGIPAGTTIYTYPVSSSISGDEVMSTITSPVGGTGTVSSSGGAITTVSTEDSNVSYTPVSGGNTVDDTEHNYVNDVVSSIDDTLSDFTSGISNLLSAPIGHINNLINSGSSFLSHLSGLWSWLPSEVVNTISGALSLVITVGIFKVFL